MTAVDGIEGERYDEAVSRGIQSTAARRDTRLILVRLVCNEDELVRRIQSAGRKLSTSKVRRRLGHACHGGGTP